MSDQVEIVGFEPPPGEVQLSAAAKLPGLIERATEAILTKAKSITIATDEDYVKAGEFGAEAKRDLERVEAERVEMKQDFLRGGKRVDDHYRAPLANLTKAIEQVKAYMGVYNAEKRRLAAIEQKRIDDERAARAAEAKRLEDAALAKIREEEQARLRAAEAQAEEERKRREAAEAETRRAVEAQQAADARAAGDRVAAEAADKRAAQAEEEAKSAQADAATERAKALEAKRAELRAKRETAAAVQSMDTANAAATAAIVPAATARVAGANDRITVKWKFRNVAVSRIPTRYLTLDKELLQMDIDRMKDSAQGILGDWVEVYSEEAIALKKGSKT